MFTHTFLENILEIIWVNITEYLSLVLCTVNIIYYISWNVIGKVLKFILDKNYRWKRTSPFPTQVSGESAKELKKAKNISQVQKHDILKFTQPKACDLIPATSLH